MSRIVVKVTMRLLSDTIFASGNSVPGGEDIALRLDSEGKPFLPGSTLKGLLRESLENYLRCKPTTMYPMAEATTTNGIVMKTKPQVCLCKKVLTILTT